MALCGTLERVMSQDILGYMWAGAGRTVPWPVHPSLAVAADPWHPGHNALHPSPGAPITVPEGPNNQEPHLGEGLRGILRPQGMRHSYVLSLSPLGISVGTPLEPRSW